MPAGDANDIAQLVACGRAGVPLGNSGELLPEANRLVDVVRWTTEPRAMPAFLSPSAARFVDR